MGSVITETYIQFTEISLRLIYVQKKFQKNDFKQLTAIKFNSFQQKSINMLSYVKM